MEHCAACAPPWRQNPPVGVERLSVGIIGLLVEFGFILTGRFIIFAITIRISRIYEKNTQPDN